MASTGMNGPFALTRVCINEVVTKISAGVYALGYVNQAGNFVIRYIGRSDSNLNERLNQWVDAKKEYLQFKAEYSLSAVAAFKRECNLYHVFEGHNGKLDNDIHPDRSKNDLSVCDGCYLFD